MTINDLMMDMEARAFAEFAESNPRLKELAGKDSYNNLTPAEQDELFELLNQAEDAFYGLDEIELCITDEDSWEENPWWD